jgi:hypothetical protein
MLCIRVGAGDASKFYPEPNPSVGNPDPVGFCYTIFKNVFADERIFRIFADFVISGLPGY